jgi:rubrerythrin
MVLHESEFEEWNKRVFECIANDDGTIEILGHRLAPLRTCRNVDEYAEAGFFTCGACGFGNNSIELTPNYCPACGAKVIAQ